MDIFDLVKLMLRRWYATVPVVLATAVAAYAVGSSIQPEYQTTVAVMLVPPTVSAVAPAPGESPQPGNPWLQIGEGAMAQAVQISTSAHDARSRVAAAGGDPNYEVDLVPRSSILTVEIAAATRDQALATVDATTSLINDEVARQQSRYGGAGGAQITTQVLDAGRNISPSRSNVLRVQIVLLFLGVLLAAAAGLCWDAVARRRTAAPTGQHRDPGNDGQAPSDGFTPAAGEPTTDDRGTGEQATGPGRRETAGAGRPA
nr:hypothetical protein [Micromonospora sp. DSM 115978]